MATGGTNIGFGAIAVTLAGAALVVSGIKGGTISNTVRDFLTNQPFGATTAGTGTVATGNVPSGAPSNMPGATDGTPLSYAQLRQLWINAGGPSNIANLMAAIALAESTGRPNAYNPIDNNGTQTSWGLWQISNGTHTPPDPNIFVPSVNAQYAVSKYQSQGLGAWGTYTSGAFMKYLQGGS